MRAIEHRIGYFSDHRRGCRASCYCGWSGPWREDGASEVEVDGVAHIGHAIAPSEADQNGSGGAT